MAHWSIFLIPCLCPILSCLPRLCSRGLYSLPDSFSGSLLPLTPYPIAHRGEKGECRCFLFMVSLGRGCIARTFFFLHLLGPESRGVMSVSGIRASPHSPLPSSPAPHLPVRLCLLPASLPVLFALFFGCFVLLPSLCLRLSAVCSLYSLFQLREAVDLKGINISGVWGAVEVGWGPPGMTSEDFNHPLPE